MNFPNLPSWYEICQLFYSNWQDLWNTNFWQIKFSDSKSAVFLGGVILAIVFVRLLIRREFHRRGHSGVFATQEIGSGFFMKTARISVKCLSLVPIIFLLLAIADPVLMVTKEEKKIIESRIRIDIRDGSASMMTAFANSSKTRAEVAADAHLRFLEMRRGKNDRVSLWIFSDNPYMIEDFVADDDLYFFQSYFAPIALSGCTYTTVDRCIGVKGEAGTAMGPAIRAALDQFDGDAKRQKRNKDYKKMRKAILIITDAGIDDFDKTEAEFQRMRERRIVPYIIYIDAIEANNSSLEETKAKLLALAERLGGKWFPVSDELSIQRAYREIDRMEKVKEEVTHRVLRVPVFYKFIFLGVLSFGLVILFGLITELLFTLYV